MRFLREILTILMVTLVAALIWAFAEAESLRKGEVAVELYFEPDATADRQLKLRSPAEAIGDTDMVRLTVRLEGTALSVDQAERVLRKPLHFRPFDKSIPVTPGEHSLDLRKILSDHPDIREVAATIAAVEPATVPGRVEELGTREVDVRVELATGQAEMPPIPKPAKVTIRAPKDVIGSLPTDTVAIAMLEAPQLERLLPGKSEMLAGVRLSLPEALQNLKGIRLNPPNIDVELVLAQRTPTSRPLNVPVHVVLATVEQKRWDITFDQRFQFVPDVTVTGPPEVIRQIEDRKVQVIALLNLSFNELEGAAVQTKEVVFMTMPQVQAPLRFSAPSKAVTFTIARRDPAKR